MSIIRNTASGLQRGRVGNTTFYVAKGQQVARQSRNNSNYGVDASRTRAQQERRVVWSNLVNVYKACKFWMPKAFESRKRNQSDYNRFMSVNIGISGIPLTKDEALNGCAVMAGYMVSQGSLAPIAYTSSAQGQNVTTDIAIGNITLTSATIAEVSAAIIANNPEYMAGDNIALVLFKTTTDSRNYPYTSCVYREFTLDLTNEQPFPTSQIYEFVSSSGTVLQVKSSVFGLDLYQCVALIHTRKVAGQLQTSTQYAYPNLTDYWDEYSTQRRMEEAIQSYGVAEDVPLDPSFSEGVITSVTLNGVVSPAVLKGIVNKSSYQEIIIYGQDLNDDNIYLDHDGIRYTPVASSPSSRTYILSSNGLNRIYLNGQLVGGVRIVGITEPTFVPFDAQATQATTSTLSPSIDSRINLESFSNVKTIQYAHKVATDYPYFSLRFKNLETMEDITYHNCTVENEGFASDYYRLIVLVEDSDKPAYISHGDFIIAIFNY